MDILNKLISKILNDKLLISKVGFTLINLMIIFLLNIIFEDKLSGSLLFAQSIILLLATGSRMGSDFYWVSSDDLYISISKYELLFLFITSSVLSFVCVIFDSAKSVNDFLWILASVININVIIFLARCYQKGGEHIKSLFLFTVGPMVFTVPLLYFFRGLDINIIIFMSTTLILSSFLLLSKPNVKFNYQQTINIKERLNFFPMIFYGFLNQNIISLYAGYISKEEHTALLVLFQRICGLTLWPQIFHIQKNLPMIKDATKNRIAFIEYFIKYLISIKKELLMYSFLSILIVLIVTNYMNTLNFYSFLGFSIILLSTLINLLFGYMKYQVGVTKNGIALFYAILFSLAVIPLFAILPYIEYVSIVLVFLFYNLFNNVFTFLLLISRLTAK